MTDQRKRTLKDWLIVAVIAVIIVAAFAAPAYVIREQRQETERVIALIEEQSARRLEQAILVNTFTISCLLAIAPEDRTDQLFRECIEEGFEQAPDIEAP